MKYIIDFWRVLHWVHRSTTQEESITMAKPGSRVALVANGLRQGIQQGTYAEGSRLPTESEIAEQFGVSRPTVRAALRELKTLSLVTTQHGVGTFVAERPTVSVGLERLDSITESIRNLGRDPGMIFKSKQLRSLLPDEAEKLDVPGDTMALEVRRTILADGEVVAYSYDLIPVGVFPEGESPDVLTGSLFAYLRDERDIYPDHAVAEIHAVQSDHIGWDFAAGKNTLYVLLDQVHYDQSCLALMYSRTYFLEGKYAFSIRRTI